MALTIYSSTASFSLSSIHLLFYFLFLTHFSYSTLPLPTPFILIPLTLFLFTPLSLHYTIYYIFFSLLFFLLFPSSPLVVHCKIFFPLVFYCMIFLSCLYKSFIGLSHLELRTINAGDIYLSNKTITLRQNISLNIQTLIVVFSYSFNLFSLLCHFIFQCIHSI